MPLRSILKDFIHHVENLEKRRLLGDNLYDREFQKLKELTDRLKNDPSYACKAGQLEINRRKNRYKDILPYDRTRVVLLENNDDPYSDYINASYIKGSSGSMAYIAAQGPLPQTVNDFWRMVWQCEVQVVVMACNEREGGKTKCDYYWPPLGEKKLYQDIMIQTVKLKPICEDFLVRTWKLVRGSEQRTVCQFHYMTWPDHGIPSSVNPILQMIRLIRNCQATETIPVLVHCSAGCGRTGTFCAIDQVWGLLRSGKLQTMFSLYKMVSEMRHQRVAMVQTKEQYMLVHRAVATLFQQQLCIIDSHPYQNINKLGEPLASLDDNHIYENVDPFLSAYKDKDELIETRLVKPTVHHPPRLETPPSSETETDHSSEEFEAFEARYSLNLSKLDKNRAGTLPSIGSDGVDHLTLPPKRQSQTLVNLQEEEHIKKLLSELNKTSSNGQSSYKPRCKRTGSQDDINVTYSPERSFVYLSDSDNSDEEIHYQPDVVRKPSIAKLKALFEKSNYRLDLQSSSPSSRREITRSHSQRVTRSNASSLPGQQFHVPVIKSDSFNVFDLKNKRRPFVQQRGEHVQRNETADVDSNLNTFDHSPVELRDNSVHIENKRVQDQDNAPEKPQLPKKQRNMTKTKVNNTNSKFYTDTNTVNVMNIVRETELNRIRNRSNEFTSTGTRKPPVLPRKKFIGGRSSDVVTNAQNVSPDIIPDKSAETNHNFQVPEHNVNETLKLRSVGSAKCLTSARNNEFLETENRILLEDEAEKFHGSGGSIFYGPCATTDSNEPIHLSTPNGQADKKIQDEKVRFSPNQKSGYTNVTPQAKKNIEQIQTVVDQCPRGAIIDLTSTKKSTGSSCSPQSSETRTPSDKSSINSESGSQTVTFDVVLPPKKPSKGYEPIWLGPNQKMSSSCDPSSDSNNKSKLIRESNYGRITPRCKSEEKLLECINQAGESLENTVIKGAGYGRIVLKASSEPPSVVNRYTADANSSVGTSDNVSSSDSSNSSSNLCSNSSTVPNLLIHSPLTQRKLSSGSSGISSKSMTAAEPEFNVAVAEIRNLIDELMFDSSGAIIYEQHPQPKRERCHSLDLLCADSNEQPDVRERRPSTDLLDDTKQLLESMEVTKRSHINSVDKPPPDKNLTSKQTVHNIPPVPSIHNTTAADSDDATFISANSDRYSSSLSNPTNEKFNECTSVYYTADEATSRHSPTSKSTDPILHSVKNGKNSSDSTWMASNWSEKIKEPLRDVNYKAISSTVLRNNSAQNQRIYDDPSELCLPEIPPHGLSVKKSRTNITRSVSARETKRPIVIKRNADNQFGHHSAMSSATMRPHNIANMEQVKCKKPYPLPINPSESNSKVINDDGYVTLAETVGTPHNKFQKPKAADIKGDVSTKSQLYPIADVPPPKSPLHLDDHQYATIHNYPDQNQSNRSEHFLYRTLPQPPPPSQDPPLLTRMQPDEHIYSLPTLPKYRPPPPPPQQKLLSNPDLPTPPPSSEETSSSSSQSDTRPEPLYSHVQKPKRETPQFVLSESLISTGYGHILTKSNFSHDDLDVNDKPVAPPRKGRRQHKYGRHSMLDLDSKKYNWNEDNQVEKSSPQWCRLHQSMNSDKDSDTEEKAPNIPQKTAAAFQVPDEDGDTGDGSEDSSSSSVSLNSSLGSGTNMKLDDSHGSSILSRSISKAFGKLNLFNRLGVKPDPSVTSETCNSNENIHSQTSPRISRKSSEAPPKGQCNAGMGFPNRLNKYPKGCRPIPQNWKS